MMLLSTALFAQTAKKSVDRKGLTPEQKRFEQLNEQFQRLAKTVMVGSREAVFSQEDIIDSRLVRVLSETEDSSQERKKYVKQIQKYRTKSEKSKKYAQKLENRVVYCLQQGLDHRALAILQIGFDETAIEKRSNNLYGIAYAQLYRWNQSMRTFERNARLREFKLDTNGVVNQMIKCESKLDLMRQLVNVASPDKNKVDKVEKEINSLFKNIRELNRRAPNEYWTEASAHLLYAYGLQKRGSFKKAIDHFNYCLATFHYDSPNVIRDARIRIEQCKNAFSDGRMEMSYYPPFGLDKKVNTIYDEYSPILDPSDTTHILFASRRPGFGELDNLSGRPNEAIYSANVKGRITTSDAHLLRGRINSTGTHTAPSSFSSDGKTLYFYRDGFFSRDLRDNIRYNAGPKAQRAKFRWNDNGDLYEATINEDSVQIERKLPADINVKGNDCHIYMMRDGKHAFVASARAGGYGARDLYYAVVNGEGRWQLKNMGGNINTDYDEYSPYYDEQDSILYYCHNGRYSIGGYDILRCRKLANGEWSKPERMPRPVNSYDDDIDFLVNQNGTFGLLASNRESTIGGFDIYKVSLVPITVEDNRIDSIIMASLGAGYRTSLFNLPDSLDYRNIDLTKLKQLNIENVYFDFDQNTLRPKSIADLNNFIALLKSDRKIIAALSGHTDWLGTDDYNMWLSLARVKTVWRYMDLNNVSPYRMQMFWYGESRPFDTNVNEVGRQLNRRVELLFFEIPDDYFKKKSTTN
jgi:outer membrane protein OmpA-like peptidoglycan-associated protein